MLHPVDRRPRPTRPSAYRRRSGRRSSNSRRGAGVCEKRLDAAQPDAHPGQSGSAPLPEGGFGAVLARAGVGKTAFLVQLALDSLLRGEPVLHISLDAPVQKVDLWYREVLANIAAQQAVNDIAPLWRRSYPTASS